MYYLHKYILSKPDLMYDIISKQQLHGKKAVIYVNLFKLYNILHHLVHVEGAKYRLGLSFSTS